MFVPSASFHRALRSKLSALGLIGVMTGAVGTWAEEKWGPSTAVFEFRDSGAQASWRSNTVIGDPQVHTARAKETLLDIARRYHLGYLEIIRANPKVDPWLPEAGSAIPIPSQWILPNGPRRGLVLNIPEMRLYYYLGDSRVMTFPLGVGVEGQDTPQGLYRIGEKRSDPVWHVPPSIQKEMEKPVKSVPPGPDNPLGKYWMRLSSTSYGIHGTNNPWAIGRYVTHGCIRLYPEDIEYLYTKTRARTPVRVIYQHAKVGFKRGQPYFQVYRHRGYTDAELMKDLIQQTWNLGIDADLRKLRRLLLNVTDGAMVPIPVKDESNRGQASVHQPAREEQPELVREQPSVRQPVRVRAVKQPVRVGFKQGKPYFQVHRHGSQSDGELMKDLIEETWRLGIDADLRKLRRLLLSVADDAPTPIPLKGE